MTFTAPASGASGAFSNSSNTITVTTNSSGMANAGTFTANAALGGYSVIAGVAGLGSTAAFSLTNTAGAAAYLDNSRRTGAILHRLRFQHLRL